MSVNFEAPVTTENNGPMGGSTTTHPAYAQICASRVSGHANLYGSEFNHQHFVSIHIHKSEHRRTLSNDWHYARGELIEVSMSEAQWASFVSGMNVGHGPCCTIQHINCKPVPQLPDPKVTTAHFRAEIAEVYREAQAELIAIAGELGEAIGKRKAEEIRRRVQIVAGRVVGSAVFVADQFDEHMENTTEKAKIEVNAFVESAINRAGLQAIANGTAVLSLPGEKE